MDCSPTVQCHWVTTNCYPSSPHLQMMNSRSFEYLFRIAHFYDPWEPDIPILSSSAAVVVAATCVETIRTGCSAISHSQESAAGSSVAVDSHHRGSRLRATLTTVQQALCTRRVRPSVRRSYCGHCYFSCLYAVRSERLLMEQLNYHLFSLVRRAEPGDGV